MIQYGSSLGLALKTGDRLRVMGHVFGQELERDQAAELQVLSFVHDAHAAAAQLLEDPVVRNAVADHWGKILGLEVAQVNEGANVGCIPTCQVQHAFVRCVAAKYGELWSVKTQLSGLKVELQSRKSLWYSFAQVCSTSAPFSSVGA